jgi:hypothetical protein
VSAFMLSVIILNVIIVSVILKIFIMASVIALIVVMLNVVAPFTYSHKKFYIVCHKKKFNMSGDCDIYSRGFCNKIFTTVIYTRNS